MKTDTWVASDWKFKGEGGASVVLAYRGYDAELRGKVLRLKKWRREPKKACCPGFRDAERAIWDAFPHLTTNWEDPQAWADKLVAYARDVFGELLPPDCIGLGVPLDLSPSFLRDIEARLQSRLAEPGGSPRGDVCQWINGLHSSPALDNLGGGPDVSHVSTSEPTCICTPVQNAILGQSPSAPAGPASCVRRPSAPHGGGIRAFPLMEGKGATPVQGAQATPIEGTHLEQGLSRVALSHQPDCPFEEAVPAELALHSSKRTAPSDDAAHSSTQAVQGKHTGHPSKTGPPADHPILDLAVHRGLLMEDHTFLHGVPELCGDSSYAGPAVVSNADASSGPHPQVSEGGRPGTICVEIKPKCGFLRPTPTMDGDGDKHCCGCVGSSGPGAGTREHDSASSKVNGMGECGGGSMRARASEGDMRDGASLNEMRGAVSLQEETRGGVSLKEMRELKSRVTRFAMHQRLKLAENKIMHESAYCPVDLFSGDPTRIARALQALIATPQNNLRVFVDGRCVHGGYGSAEGSEALAELVRELRPWLGDNHAGGACGEEKSSACVATLVRLLADVLAVERSMMACLLAAQMRDKYDVDGALQVYQSYVRRFGCGGDACKLDRQVHSNGKTTGQYSWPGVDGKTTQGASIGGHGNHTADAGTTANGHSLNASLSDGAQDSSSGAHRSPSPDASTSSTAWDASMADTTLDARAADTARDASMKVDSAHVCRTCVERWSDATCAAVLRDFLIAATAKDCALMVTLQRASVTAVPNPPASVTALPTSSAPVTASGGVKEHGAAAVQGAGTEGGGAWTPAWGEKLVTDSAGRVYRHKVSFIDLDLKPLSRIPDYFATDVKIVKHYLEQWFQSALK
eukprot:jgi/Mesvir1/461/Mv11339-RA.1